MGINGESDLGSSAKKTILLVDDDKKIHWIKNLCHMQIYLMLTD
jgi:hypothetical protein